MQEIIKKLESMDACGDALAFLENVAKSERSYEEIFEECVYEGWVRWFTREVSGRPMLPGTSSSNCSYCTKLNARRIATLTFNQILQCLECEWRS